MNDFFTKEMVKNSNQPQNVNSELMGNPSNPIQHLETSQRGFHSEIGESDAHEKFDRDGLSTLIHQVLVDNLRGDSLLQEIVDKKVEQEIDAEIEDFTETVFRNYDFYSAGVILDELYDYIEKVCDTDEDKEERLSKINYLINENERLESAVSNYPNPPF